jgi:ParB family chromosome partitioning protein
VSQENAGRRRASLGRGLEALFGEDDDYGELSRVRQSRLVGIEFLTPNPYQPRKRFDDEAFDNLVDSIREQGVLQPILVRQLAGSEGHYQIIAGERRWRAAQQAQLHEVPVVVRDLTDREALQIAIVENVQRQDLTALEEANGYRRLIDEFHHTQEDIARAVGKSRSHIANTLRLLDLPDEVQGLLQQGQLSAGHARALIGCPDPVAAARKVVDDGMTVRQTESLARELTESDGEGQGRRGGRRGGRGGGAGAPAEKDPDTLALEEQMSDLLGLKVTISTGRGEAGTLAIHYDRLEQLDDVLQRLSGGRG